MSQDTAPETAVPEVRGDIGTAARETLEDYTLRFAPRSYRKWSTGVVAISALGGIAYLADFAIGANIGISYGTTNALWGILDHPGQRLRLLQLSRHERHLRDVHVYPSGDVLACHVCSQDFERPDVVACLTHSAHVCSLCLSTDKTGVHVLPATSPA